MSGIRTVGQSNNFQLNKEVASNPAPSTSTKAQPLNNIAYNNSSSSPVDENILSNGIKNVFRATTGEIEHIKQVVALSFPDKEVVSKPAPSSTSKPLNKLEYNSPADENILSNGIKSALRSTTGEIEHVKKIVGLSPDEKHTPAAAVGIRG